MKKLFLLFTVAVGGFFLINIMMDRHLSKKNFQKVEEERPLPQKKALQPLSVGGNALNIIKSPQGDYHTSQRTVSTRSRANDPSPSTKIYKWVDEKGIKHYSGIPPKKASSLTVMNRIPAARKALPQRREPLTRKAATPSSVTEPKSGYRMVYEWHDKTGKKHYSSRPPSSSFYTVKKLSRSKAEALLGDLPTNSYKTPAVTTDYRTRASLIKEIQDYKRKMDAEKDILKKLKKELFDISRRPGDLRYSEARQMRIKSLKESIDNSEKHLEKLQASKEKIEQDLKLGRYEK